MDKDLANFDFDRHEEEITALTQSIKSNKFEIILLLLSQLKIDAAMKLNDHYWSISYYQLYLDLEDYEKFQLHKWSVDKRCEIIENAYLEYYDEYDEIEYDENNIILIIIMN